MKHVIRPNLVFSSQGLPSDTAIDLWHDVIGTIYRVEIEQDDRDRFAVTWEAVRLDSSVISRTATTAQTLIRDATCVRQDGLDHYGFFYQERGSRVVQTNDTETILRPGDLQFVDLAQQDSSIAADGHTAALYVPRDVIEAELPDAWRLHGTVFRHSPTHAFASQILSLFDPDSDWPLDMAGSLERSLLALGIGCLASTDITAGTRSHRSGIDLSLRRQIERHIDHHLEDHTMDAQAIAEQFTISRSALYRLFKPHGGVGHYILERRLRRVRRLLLANSASTIGELAYSCGFTSQAHFSREFRRAFGETPRDVRGRGSDVPVGEVGFRSADQVFRSVDS